VGDRIVKITNSHLVLFPFPGPNAGSELNWKTRVKIALDAAQGSFFIFPLLRCTFLDLNASRCLL
jgi:hypothetical protein